MQAVLLIGKAALPVILSVPGPVPEPCSTAAMFPATVLLSSPPVFLSCLLSAAADFQSVHQWQQLHPEAAAVPLGPVRSDSWFLSDAEWFHSA